jgi:hypothetical protein
MSGFFLDWNGELRSTDDPGGGYTCEVDLPVRYVAVKNKQGTTIHEATFYRHQADLDKAKITSPVVPGSKSWGSSKEGY